MNMKEKNWYKIVEEYIVKSAKENGRERGVPHFVRTAYWVEKLKPGDEALKIAGVAHDAERIFRTETSEIVRHKSKGFTDRKFLDLHQKLSADKIAEFLASVNAPKNLIDRVCHLVIKHEDGGDEDQNILKDADSVSFFENNVELFVNEKLAENGYNNVKHKFEWMFDRITTNQAREFAREFYEDTMRKLEYKKQS